ncbi:tRNA (adenosine(37)-N6)-threonylcarbamoyltransferase complex transferase subunit TsaD [Adlercreutzia sp. ZJ154]|uniref:tRNA (adenosine(37)-N6)-threonylcarbamoyltransferase complex transferase subunit TsaD n=1 Tax=Adlercreutzia sp. ZJ154 TaxID=2709790 RepID=UPI001F14CD96|nr:tRNA (adenosine(37)-N6)-threonylcarbamoyltransferase complex transferase subunit TsaD [Adlercreutzia sp. ZJ154]
MSIFQEEITRGRSGRNMYVLAFDTANEVIAIGLGKLHPTDSSIEFIAGTEAAAKRASNTQLLPRIDQLLKREGINREDIACVCVGRGPGSFTGVRIAMATAKGIASALEVALIGVSTLDSIAWRAWDSGVRGKLLLLGDAMRKEVYPAWFEVANEGVCRLTADSVVKAQEFDATCPVPMSTDMSDSALGEVSSRSYSPDSHGSATGASGSCGTRFVNTSPKSESTFNVAETYSFMKTPLTSEPVDTTGMSDSALGEVSSRSYSPDSHGSATGASGSCGTRFVNTSPKAESANIFVGGDGLQKYAELFVGVGEFLPEDIWTPSGKGLLLALQHAWRMENSDPLDVSRHNPGKLLPVYTRLSDAEENERKKLASKEPKNLHTGVQDCRVTMHASSRVGEFANAQGIVYTPLASKYIADVADIESKLMGTDAWNKALIADELPRADRTWWRASNSFGCTVGYAGGLIACGEVQILKIAVEPQYQRCGLARQLLLRILEDARNLGATSASLEVRASNLSAIAFYEHMGFKRLGVRPRYYSDGEDAVIMGAAVDELLETSQGFSAKCDIEMPDRVHAANPLILAIESSCDETAASVIDGDGRILSDVVASQIDFHARFGGVVPEIASRKHIEAICGVCDVALENAGQIRYKNLDGVAVTYAPGLVGALVVGVAFAKGAAWAADVPFIGVNHLEGHLYANKLATESDADIPFSPPAVVSLVSGGNTMLVYMRDWGNYEILGATIDDAVGEAFDKVAKALGLPYPGGPHISRLAATGNPDAIAFPRAMIHSKDLRFSLSGLKTAVTTYINEQRAAGVELNMPDICASFQAAVVDVQVAKAKTALKQTGAKKFCLGGGVAANPYLRQAYEQMCGEIGVQLIMPPLSACGDNAAMIALVALDRFKAGKFFALDADAYAHADLSAQY